MGGKPDQESERPIGDPIAKSKIDKAQITVPLARRKEHFGVERALRHALRHSRNILNPHQSQNTPFQAGKAPGTDSQ